MLFFTLYLYDKVQSKCNMELSSYGYETNELSSKKFEDFYLSLIKSDQDSKHHL